MRRFRHAFSSSGEISSSSRGTMRGRASSSVTSLPNERKIEANSTPTAPAPTMAMLLGTRGTFRMSRLPTTTLPSNSTPGNPRASEPVANMMCVADLSVASPSLNGYHARACPAPPPPHGLHFVLAKQKFDALGVLIDDFVFAREDGGPVELEIGNFDAELLGVLEGIEDFGMVEQHLRRNTPHMQASASQKAVLLDDDGF